MCFEGTTVVWRGFRMMGGLAESGSGVIIL